MVNAKNIYRAEHSAGGCVFKMVEGNSKWLLGKHSGYHKWVLPKGMIEAGESVRETAIREVKEETGVSAKIIGNEPIFEDHYSFQAEYKQIQENERRVLRYQENGGEGTRVEKTVSYFLMEWVEGDPESDHDFEMEEAGWFTLNEALEKMSFEGEKKALFQAEEKLNENR